MYLPYSSFLVLYALSFGGFLFILLPPLACVIREGARVQDGDVYEATVGFGGVADPNDVLFWCFKGD